MENNEKRLDYQGETIFVGLDVHKKDWKVTIYISGILIKAFIIEPEPKKLLNHLRHNYPNGKYKTVYEAGFSGYWIDRELNSSGIENIIVNPADIPTSNKEKVRKTDKIDSQKLARELFNGNLRGIYIPTEEQEGLRGLNRLRIQFTKDQGRQKNRIKSLLYFVGIDFPENYEIKHWSKRFIEYLYNLEIGNLATRTILNELLASLVQIRIRLAKILLELRSYSRSNKYTTEIIRVLETVPGIGFKTAITLYTEIMDINRFKRLDDLSSYVGLVPSTHSSGEKEVIMGVCKRQNSFIRNIIIESAWVAVRKDPALTLVYTKLSHRMKKQEAIIRIAKKLLSRIMYVWKNQKEYKLSVV